MADRTDHLMRGRSFDRRSFLRLGGAFTAATIAASCFPTATVQPSGSPSPTPRPTVTPSPLPSVDLSSDAPFGLWQALRNAVRSSPDHLTAEADRVVATRDAKAIFEFVRDKIAIYPPDTRAFAKGAEYAVRWGSRGVLRGGAGTPRERADLLAELYTRAGFSAKVVAGSSALTRDQVRAALLRSIERDFLPGLSAATLAAWRRQSGLEPTPAPSTITSDVLARQADAIARPLLSQLPTAVTLPAAFDPTPGQMPFVEVAVDGETRAADPFLPDARFGTSYVTDRASEPVKVGTPSVHLELAVTTSAEPTKPRTILAADWNADQLVGRQVVLGFAPAGQALSALVTAPRDMHVFTPTAMVQAVDSPTGFIKELMVAGTALTAAGEAIVAGSDGSLQLDGRPLLSGPADPNAAARVAHLALSVDAAAFPTIEVGLTPTDAAGAIVDKLDVNAFRLTENGTVRLGFLERALALPPRVLLLFDTTGSIPPEFSGAPRTALALDLFDRLQALHPSLEAAVTALHGAPSWTSDRIALKGQLDLLGPVAGSDLWRSAADASRSGGDAVIFVTDGQADDTPTPAIEAIIAAGPAIVGLNISDATGQPTLDSMARLSDGTARPVSTAADAVAAALAAVDAHVRGLPRYRLRYRATAAGEKTRTVAVSVPASGAEAKGTYQAPATTPVAAGPVLASIRLALTVGNYRVDRVLAGYRGSDREATITPAERDEAWAALFGTTILSFEAAAPTTSQLLDDALTVRLASKSYVDSIARSDAASQLSSFGAGFPGLPPALLNLMAPLPGPDATTMTYELGPRVVLCAVAPLPGGGARSRVDILPATRFASVGPDPRTQFEATMRRTAFLAAIEGSMYDVSTAATLSGKSLRTVEPYHALSAGPALTDAQRALLDAAADRSYEPFVRFVWDGGTAPPPYWAIDPETGTLFGVLPDGTGGGEGDSHYTNEDAMDQVERWMALAQLGSDFWIEGIPGLAMSWVIAVYLEAARAYILAGAAFNTKPGGGGPPPPKLPCNAAKSAVKFALGRAFPAIDPLLKADSAADVTGHNILGC